jgi:hypothetical protein
MNERIIVYIITITFLNSTTKQQRERYKEKKNHQTCRVI